MLMKKKIYRVVVALWKDFSEKKVFASASRLTYSTLLATVPILAVVFAIARGFGYSVFIEQWFRKLFEAQPEASEIIIGFVNSYLIHTKKGIFLGIGLLFMLWTVLMLIANIEETFNGIWLVKKGRSLFRTLTDYIAMLFALPIVIVLSSGLSIWVSVIHHHVADVFVLGPLMKFLIELSPFLLMSAMFVLLYLFMPNTKVHLKSALLPGILAGTAMQLFQMLYINSQIWVSSYNAIYGTFAVLPLFMLWINISWTIILVGAELSFTIQNREDFLVAETYDKMSYNQKVALTAQVVILVNRRFKEGGKAYTAMELKEMTNCSMRVLSAILYNLVCIHFISEISHEDKSEETCYQPAEDIANLTYGELLRRLNDMNGLENDKSMVGDDGNIIWREIEDKTNSFIENVKEIKLS